MSRLRVNNVDDELLSKLDTEATQRYGRAYGSRRKWIIEAIEEYLIISKRKPRFLSLTNPYPKGLDTKKNIGKIEMKYERIIKKLRDLGIKYPQDHEKTLMSFIKEGWKSRRPEHRVELLRIWAERFGEFGELIEEEDHER